MGEITMNGFKRVVQPIIRVAVIALLEAVLLTACGQKSKSYVELDKL